MNLKRAHVWRGSNLRQDHPRGRVAKCRWAGAVPSTAAGRFSAPRGIIFQFSLSAHLLRRTAPPFRMGENENVCVFDLGFGTNGAEKTNVNSNWISGFRHQTF